MHSIWKELGTALGLMGFRLGLVIAISAALFAIPYVRRRFIIRTPIAKERIRRELLGAVGLSVVDALVFVLVHQLGGLRFGPSTLLSVPLTFLLFFVWFEIAYFGLHAALHTKALYGLHRRHHEAIVTHPLTGFAFSGIERALQTLVGLLPLALISQVAPVSQVAVECYFVLSYFLNGLAHANVELTPARWARSAVGSLFITTTFHALHHVRFRGHYGLYTTVLDRVFGTQFDDYLDLQERAAEGRGFASAAAIARPPAPRSPPLPGEPLTSPT